MPKMVIDAKLVCDTLLYVKEALERIEKESATKQIAITLVKCAREDLSRAAKEDG